MPASFRTVVLATVGVLTSGVARADQIPGMVTSVSGDVVTIAVNSERSLGVGDTVQVFGTVPGLDSEVLIGRGKISEARNGTILAKIDARGKMLPGQKARITRSQSSGSSQVPEPAKPNAEFVDLFNGRDLTGWQPPPGSNGAWSVEAGVLRAVGDPRGWLFTEREYSDLELQLEYRLAPGANGGVGFRVPNPNSSFGPDDPSHQGLEIQLVDDTRLPDDSPPHQRSGAIWGIVGPVNTTDQATERWNFLRITARGRKVAVAINATAIVDANLDDYLDNLGPFPGLQRSSGYVGLQCYEGTVEFRNLRIKRLEAPVVGANSPSLPTAPPRIISDISGVLTPTPANAPSAEMPPRSTTALLEIRGRVSGVLAGSATVQIDGRTMPNVGNKAIFVRTLNTPDSKVQLVGSGTVTEILSDEIFVELGPNSAAVTSGDQMRIALTSLQSPPQPK